MIYSKLKFSEEKGMPTAQITFEGESIFFSKGSGNNYLMLAPGLENQLSSFWVLSLEDRKRFAEWLLA